MYSSSTTLSRRISRRTSAASQRLSHRFDFPARRRAPRIGLALSGGGAKAVAHVGVFKALLNAGLHIDLVAGTSGGALAGVFFCAGYGPEAMFQILCRHLRAIKLWRWIPFGQYWRLSRLLKRGVIQEIIEKHVQARRFEDLRIPFHVTSTDLVKGEAVVHSHGDLVRAVMASMSVPGMTPPVRDGNRLLVDGAVLNHLPTEILRRQGADIIIGVDLAGYSVPDEDWTQSLSQCGGLGLVSRAWDIQNRQLMRTNLADVDVVIRPQLSEFSFADFTRMEALVERGEEAAGLAVPTIRALIRAFRGEQRMSA